MPTLKDFGVFPGLHLPEACTPDPSSSVLCRLSSVFEGTGDAASVPGVRADFPPSLAKTAPKKSAVAILHEADSISDSGWNVPCGSSRQRISKSSPQPGAKSSPYSYKTEARFQ